MFRILFTVALLLPLLACNSQSEEALVATPEEEPQLEMLKKMLYGSGSAAFQHQGALDVDLGKVKPDEPLPYKADPEKKTAAQVIEHLQNNLTAKAANSHFNDQVGLELDHGLSTGYDIDQGLLDLEVKDLNVTDADGDKLALSGSKMNNTFVFADAAKVTEPISGTVTVRAAYRDQFAVVTVGKDQVGKTVDLNGTPLEILAIDKNVAFIGLPAGKKDQSIQVANQTADGQLIGLDFDKREAANLGPMAGGQGSSVIDGEVYRIFKAQPDISFEDFGAKIHNSLIRRIREKKTDTDKVMMVSTAGFIDQLALYVAKPAEFTEIEVAVK